MTYLWQAYEALTQPGWWHIFDEGCLLVRNNLKQEKKRLIVQTLKKLISGVVTWFINPKWKDLIKLMLP